jgi:hypothetical protein
MHLKSDISALEAELTLQGTKPITTVTQRLSEDVATVTAANATTNLADVGAGLTELAGNQRKVTEATIDDALLSEYLAFRNVRNWYRAAEKAFRDESKANPADYAQLFEAYLILQNTVRRELVAHDLVPSVAAELVTGLNVFQSAGGFTSNPTPGTVTAAKAGATVAPVAYLAWESRHYGAELGTPLEFSLSGKFGQIPALVLLEPKTLPSASACAALKNPVGPCLSDLSIAFENAIAGYFSARVNRRIGEAGEFSARVGGAESYLTSESFVVGDGVGSTAALPIKNGFEQGAPWVDTAVEIKIYDKNLDLVHATKDILAPTVQAEAGFRRDYRFALHQELTQVITDATSNTVQGFDHPAQRYFYRFSLGNISLVTKDDQGPHTFVMSFGLEGEGAWPFGKTGTGPRIPSAVRFFVKGDVNIVKAFTSAGK